MRWIYEHAFAETGGMQRLLDLWERHGIRSSCYADGHTVSLFPDLARAAAASGHEFIVQGWEHSFFYDMTVAEQGESLDKTIAAFRKLGITPTGFSSPGGHVTAETFPLCAQRGLKYVVGLRNADVPFIIRIGNRKLVGMTSYGISDFSTYNVGHYPREVVRMWRDCFDALYDEGARGYPKMLAYGTHPIIAHGHRIRPLEELIRYVKGKPKVWIATRGEIADWMLTHYPEHDLAAFYPEAVNSDRHYGLGIGLGGDEALLEALRYRKN
jgi:peptidoglycan/xylan/chitin deacetylase (PgdA/CDA1 family)